MSETPPAACPGCGDKGRQVPDVTPRSLLDDEARARLDQVSDLRFCRRGDCGVVYFGGGSLGFRTKDLRVPVFQKSHDPERFVCYCFEHTVAVIRDEVRRTGRSAVPDLIATQCKLGRDRCDETNPQGACCLGNVRQVVKAAAAALGKAPARSGGADGGGPDCCAPATARVESEPAGLDPRKARRIGLWSAGGALVAALLSSACCWLPLALIGVGASAAGVAGFFEAYRGWFLGATVLLLGAGFYFVYFRKPRCAPGEACEVPNPRLQRFNRVTLWLATVFVAAFAAFPTYVGVLLGSRTGDAVAAPAEGVTRIYVIEGMTCVGCAEHLRDALRGVSGVAVVDVSYAERRATVTFGSGARVDDAVVLAAIAALGYRPTAQP